MASSLSTNKPEAKSGIDPGSRFVSSQSRTPRIHIDLGKIEHNTRALVALLGSHGIEVCAVTKATCGHPEVARAMLRGGASMLADSRLENIQRMQAAGVDCEYMLLRLPAPSAIDDIVGSVDLSLNSEARVLELLSNAARRQGRVHDVILMVDLGDLREGVWPERLPALVGKVADLPGIRINGIGANLACFGGVLPSEDNMRQLAALTGETERLLGRDLARVSGINSSGLELVAAGRMHPRINHARIGEAILLGRETTRRRAWPDTFQDAFVIYAEVLESNRKPSQPLGRRGEDAFGGHTRFEERGEESRVLLNIGREDVDIAGLDPCTPGAKILGGSSDYLVVDISAVDAAIEPGDEMAFLPNYSALLAAMTSPYVDKRLQ